VTTLYENFLAGTITDNPLLVGGTTINSANFANLPVVANPDIMYLVLDPDASDGAPEIVTITAHTSLATSVTVTRASQSTTARQHATATVWRAAFTKADADQLAAIIADGAIDTVNLADDAVTTAKILDANVTEAKIAPGAIDLSVVAEATEFRRAADQTISPSGTLISWDTEVSDPDGWGTVPTDTLTCPAEGMYIIGLVLDGGGNLADVNFRLNGTTVVTGEYSNSTGDYIQGGQAMYIRTGDEVTVRAVASPSDDTMVDATIVLIPIWKA